MVEVLLGVAVVGVLALVAIPAVQSVSSSARTATLDNDLQVLNSAVRSYLLFGGKFNGAESLDDVVAKLKTRATNESARQVVGLTGSFLDPRFEAVKQTTEEAAGENPRILWNPATSKFEFASSGSSGVKEFRLNEKAINQSAPEFTENRETSMAYAKDSNWIWDYKDPGKPVRMEPSVFPVRSVELPLDAATPVASPLISSTPPASGSPSLPPVTPPPPAVMLNPPTFSVPGGRYPITGFDMAVSIANPNLPASSAIVYSINFGPWVPYSGGHLSIASDTVLKAQAMAISSLYTASGVVQNNYDTSAVTLLPPGIVSSAAAFVPGAVETVNVVMNNPNNPAVSRLDYRINGGAWQPYTGPLSLPMASYSSGALIEATVAGTKEYWLNSGFASVNVGAPVPASILPNALTDLCKSRLNQYGVVVLGGEIKTSGNHSGVAGDVAIAPGGFYNFGTGAVTGTMTVDPTVVGGSLGNIDNQFGPGGSPVPVVSRDLSSLKAEAIALSSALSALPATASYGKINSEMTISSTASNGLNVVRIDEISLSGSKKFTVKGGAGDYFVINIASTINITGSSSLEISGGIKPSHVIFNFLPGSGAFKLSGTSAGYPGTFLAPHSGNKATYTGSSLLSGSLIVGGGVTMTGGSQIGQSNFNCSN